MSIARYIRYERNLLGGVWGSIFQLFDDMAWQDICHMKAWCSGYHDMSSVWPYSSLFINFLCLLFWFFPKLKKRNFRCKYLCSWASCHKMICVMWKPYARLSCHTTGLAQLLLIYELFRFFQSWQDFENIEKN